MNNPNKKNFIIYLIIILMIAAGAAGYFRRSDIANFVKSVKGQSGSQTKNNPEEVKKVVNEVGKLIKLPDGETPILGVVTDINQLKSQPFFQKSKNGDELLIYSNAKKIILYDPVAKQIVDVAPISIGSNSGQPATEAKISLRNGTLVTGLANKVESDLKKTFPDADIVNKDNAARNDYDKTIIVVLNPTAKDAADKISKALNIPISDLPLGENKVAGIDILIILGKDKTQ